MKPTSHCPHGQSASWRASRYLMLAALLAAPLAQAQSNAPVTGSMLQETPEQRARMEQAARQAQAEEQARRAAAAQQQAAQQQAQQQAAQAQREAQLRAAQQQRAAATTAAPAATRPASPVVRQVPGPGQAPAAAAQTAPAARQQVVQSPEQRVTTVVTPQAATPAQPAPAAAAPAVAAAPRTEPAVAAALAAPQGRSRPNGDVTSEVLRMQAEGRQAGQALPMLGATASPSWKRYIDSYSHPIPEYYETTSQPKQ